jgi:hypothetical protein
MDGDVRWPLRKRVCETGRHAAGEVQKFDPALAKELVDLAFALSP